MFNLNLHPFSSELIMKTQDVQKFFSKINYSAANEDPISEIKALKISGDDEVLAISGSGARSLDLLTQKPKRIVSIDFNPTQNHLLALKIEAYKHLDYESFCYFVGLSDKAPDLSKRVDIYWDLRNNLSKTSSDFWDSNLEDIRNGVLYCGQWERFIRYMSSFSKPLQKTIDRMFTASTIEEQVEIWQQHWNTKFWRFCLQCCSRRFLWKHVFKEPGIDCVPYSFNICKYMYDCFEKVVRQQLMRDNPFLQLIFFGRYHPDFVKPLHLQKEHFNLIKNYVERVEVVTGSLVDFLHDEGNRSRFNGFSLSDFSSYAPDAAYQAIWEGVVKSGAEGAKVCERQFLVKRRPEDALGSVINRDLAMQDHLAKIDHSFIYTFICGSLKLAV